MHKLLEDVHLLFDIPSLTHGPFEEVVLLVALDFFHREDSSYVGIGTEVDCSV